jgi:hypothetical protein
VTTLFATASRPALESTHTPIQWVPGAFSPAVKPPECEDIHSSASSAEVKNAWTYTSSPSYVLMAWYLLKHKDNFVASP